MNLIELWRARCSTHLFETKRCHFSRPTSQQRLDSSRSYAEAPRMEGSISASLCSRRTGRLCSQLRISMAEVAGIRSARYYLRALRQWRSAWPLCNRLARGIGKHPSTRDARDIRTLPSFYRRKLTFLFAVVLPSRSVGEQKFNWPRLRLQGLSQLVDVYTIVPVADSKSTRANNI